MSLSPAAAATNYHKLDGSKANDIYSLKFWKPESKISIIRQTSRCGQLPTPSRHSSGECSPCLLQLWRPSASLGLWLHLSNLCLCLHMGFSFAYFSSSEPSPEGTWMSVVLPTVWLRWCRIFLPCASKFFQISPIIQCQSHFYPFRHLLQEHSTFWLLVKNLLS